MCASSTQHNSFGLGSPERSRNWRLLYLPFVLLLDSDHATGSGVLRVRSGLGRVLGIGLRRPLVCAVGDFPLARGIRGQ